MQDEQILGIAKGADPNELLSRNSKVFIFVNGELHVGGYDSHQTFMKTEPLRDELYNAYEVQFGPIQSRIVPNLWHKFQKVALFGRVGYRQEDEVQQICKICSVWNDNPQLLGKLLKPCVSALVQRKVLDSDDVVVVPPFANPQFVGQLLGGSFVPHPLSGQESDALNRGIANHLLAGNLKRQSLLDRGVRPKRRVLSPGERLIPGQKSWALTSEGFKKWFENG